MQDIILRVFVVAVSLLYPIPREEWTLVEEEDIAMGMQEREVWLLKQRAKLEKEQEVPLINQEVSPVVTQQEAPVECKHRQLDVKPHQPDIVDININEIDVNHSQEDLKKTPSEYKHTQEKREGAAFCIDHKLSQICEHVTDKEQNFSTVGKVQSHTQPSHRLEYLTGRVLSNPQQEVQLQPIRRKSSEDQKRLTQQQSNKNQEETQILSQSPEDDRHRGKHDTIWYLWNIYTLICLSRWFFKLFRRNSQKNPYPGELFDEYMKDGSVIKNLSSVVLLPDSDTLNRFYDKHVKGPSGESRRVREFVEGFVNDLLEAMSGHAEAGVVTEDFDVVEDGTNSLVCEVIVPIAPLEPQRFQFQLWCDQDNEDYMPPEVQGFGRVKVVSGDVGLNGCPCHNATVNDMLCLLCCDNDKIKPQEVTDVLNSPLCSKNTPYLNKTKVTKGFQTAIRRAWEQVSHKYEFELQFRNMDFAGALSVRFRSGRVITFNIRPVVKLKDTDAYFTIDPYKNILDTDWILSLATYENRFLKYLINHLPENPCHIHCFEITALLHKKQMELTGRSVLILKDYHLKTVLMHLLLIKEPSEWSAGLLSYRLRDMLGFLEKSLRSRTLHHSFIGNPLVPSDIKLPAVFTEAKPVNLFHPHFVQSGSYARTAKHLQEMLRNSFMLIHEYVEH
ncbi:inositol 1,4,5-trisphosphate receptor-interacting protein-like [Esox lucius]|uniref:Inositol 1,4,5-trisphosphate receptor-interacting protein n=1 Tax=Esox lucius TaxID=8010 RepID=A0A3P8ZEJ5_ESOLU|nr:inositol 1,4,5-trisphosphate receptor-interacting protein-like [Esox lucius]